MSNLNDQLYNAALAAFVGGALNASIVDSVQADYASIANAGAAFAAQVDAGIAADSGLVTPVTAYTLKRVNLLQSICIMVMQGRYPVGASSLVSATYALNAAAIAAAYKQAATVLA